MVHADKVVRFISETTFADLPGAVIHQGKRCLLDVLGAMIAGSATPVAQGTAAFAKEHLAAGNGAGATILADGSRVSPVGAALANGFAANALDIDDGHRLVKGHPGACVAPVVIAAAQTAPRVSGADVLTALVVAYETAIRAGMIRHAISETYHFTGSWGAVGGIAGAAKLLGCDAERTYQAMTTAEAHGPMGAMMKVIDRPSMVKDGIGWGAMVAMASVLMARTGFTGAATLFDDTPDPSWIDELGSRYRILDLYFKPYACCRWAQPAIAAVLKVTAEHAVPIDGIKRIRVGTFAAAKSLSCAPPGTTEEAQYNLAYPLAAALIDGEVGPRQVLPSRIFDRDVLELAARVEVEVVAEYDALFPEKTVCAVTIETEEGKQYRSGPVEPKWEPPDFPTDQELQDKFQWLVTPILGRRRTLMVADGIRSLEKADSIGGIIDLSKRCD